MHVTLSVQHMLKRQQSTSTQTHTQSTDTQSREERPVLLVFVSGLASLAAAVLPVGGWDGVDRGALLAGRVRRMRGVASSGLACVVVKLH